MPVEKSAGAVIFRKNKEVYYLLLHYEARHWDFPKGKIEEGETLEETAKREIFEETGIGDVEFVIGFKETIKYFYRKEGEDMFKIVVFFLAQTKAEDVKISREHVGFKWLPYEEALEQLTFKNAKEILKKANGRLSKKDIRSC